MTEGRHGQRNQIRRWRGRDPHSWASPVLPLVVLTGRSQGARASQLAEFVQHRNVLFLLTDAQRKGEIGACENPAYERQREAPLWVKPYQ